MCSVCSPATARSPLPTDRLRSAPPADRWPIAPNLMCRATRRSLIRILLWLPPTTGPETGQTLHVDPPTDYRPEAATSGLVAQVGAVVHGTSEDTRAGAFHESHSVRP